jgi:hypothetical protein
MRKETKKPIVQALLMKKGGKPNPLKFFNDNRAKAVAKAGGAMKAYNKNLKKAKDGRSSNPCPAGYYWNGSECVEGQNTGGFGKSQAEYDRNIKRLTDAGKELDFIVRSKYNENNPIRNYGGANDLDFREKLPKYLNISTPMYATDASMDNYDKEIAAYYKANPNQTRYVGRLPIRKVELTSTVNKDLRKKGGATKAKPKAKKK